MTVEEIEILDQSETTEPTSAFVLPVKIIAVAVVIATIVGSLLGLGATQRYRSNAIFSITRLEGSDASRAQLKQISEELVVVANLPSVRQEVRRIGGVVPSFEFTPDVSTDEDAEGIVVFSASHPDPEVAEVLARALATESVRFLIEGHTDPVDDPLAEAVANTEQVILDQGFLISTVSTEPISSWPSFVRSAVVAAMVTMLTAVSLFALQGTRRTRRDQWSKKMADKAVRTTARTARLELQQERLEGVSP